MKGSAILKQLPAPPPGKHGWPWDQEAPSSTATKPPVWPRISIVTISYNQVSYLEETIRSVLLQGYPNLEYIVVDGGSTDGGVDIIQKYVPWLAWWVSEPDRGQSHAINKGFARCTGEIITFISSDDTYLPGALLDVARRWQAGWPYGAVIGGFYFQDAESCLRSEAIRPLLAVQSPVDLTLGPPGVYRLHQVATFYTRAALDAVGRSVREDMRYVMDRELLYRICRQFPLLLVDDAYGIFRKHPESKSMGSILPFAREFAQLYLLNLNGNRPQDRLRKGMARYRLARGWMKYANAVGRPSLAIAALLKAAWHQPSYILQPGYLSAWKHLLQRSPGAEE